MQITVAQGAVKHQLSVEGEETVRAVKARLEELCSIPAVQQKLLVKGKEAADARLATAELDPQVLRATCLRTCAPRCCMLENGGGHETRDRRKLWGAVVGE